MATLLSLVAGALFALQGAPFAREGETYEATVLVRGMSCPMTSGMAARKGLEAAPGVKSVKVVGLIRNGKGTYRLTIDRAHALKIADLEDALLEFEIDRVELRVPGTVAKTEKGLVLRAAGSGAVYELANRKKKDKEKEAPNVLGAIEEFLAKGETSVVVKGQLVQEKDKSTLLLDSAELPKKEEPKSSS